MTSEPYTEGADFILEEVIRYAQMPLEELKSHVKEIGLNNLKDANGHMRPTGRRALRRLEELTERTLLASSYRGRVDLNRAVQLVQERFGEAFLRADFANPSEAELQKLFEDWIAEAAADCRRRVHIIPCHLTLAGVDQITVGPVTVKTRHAFEPAFRPELEAYRARRDVRGEPYGEQVAADVRDYLSAFGEVAEVEVPNADAPTSRAAAEAALQVLLDYIHVMAGAGYTARMRGPGPAIGADRRAAIARVDGELVISTSIHYGGANIADHAWRQLTNGDAERRLAPLAFVLQMIVEKRDLPLLADRFVDACAWYGDAAREPSPGAAAVKFVTVMERLLWTGEQSGITKRVSQRLAALCFSPQTWNLKEVEAEVRDAYRLRSDLLHGRIAKSDPSIGRQLRLCERHARALLMIWWERFSDAFAADVRLERLRDYLDQFTADAQAAAAARDVASMSSADVAPKA